MTLAFLGEVPVSGLGDLLAIGRQVQAGPFDLKIDHLGDWSHNHLLWASCNEVPLGLSQLQHRLQFLLAEAGYSQGVAEQRFTPHITLIRKLPAATAATGAEHFPCPENMSWSCRSFVLVQSVLMSTGPNYRILEEFFLR